VPLLAKLHFGETFASEPAGVEFDEDRCLAIPPDDDCRFALRVRDDHGVIVTAPALARYADCGLGLLSVP
jgi:hypothetical protein